MSKGFLKTKFNPDQSVVDVERSPQALHMYEFNMQYYFAARGYAALQLDNGTYPTKRFVPTVTLLLLASPIIDT